MSCVAACIVAPDSALDKAKMLALKQGSLCRYWKPLSHDNQEESTIMDSSNLQSNIKAMSARPYMTLEQKNKISTRFPNYPPSLEELHRGKAFSLHRYLAKTRPSRPSSPNGAASPAISDVSIGHYFHAEMQFVNGLIDISSRLSKIPKDARQKALQAELNLLNHNLPANVCIPLWCKTLTNHQHHKIVRISPQDAVILNSAERVPYLILVEVLVDECEESFQELINNCPFPNNDISGNGRHRSRAYSIPRVSDQELSYSGLCHTERPLVSLYSTRRSCPNIINTNINTNINSNSNSNSMSGIS